MRYGGKVSKQHIKQLIVFILCFIILIIIPIESLFASYKKTLGTNVALGSPLLNENFETDDWNPWEMVCFGVFLSNFCVPFTDDYESAFSSSANNGSKGKGLEALIFGTGEDSQTQAALEPMLKYALDAQKKGVKPIKTQLLKHIIKDNVDVLEISTEYTDAKFRDMLAPSENGFGIEFGKSISKLDVAITQDKAGSQEDKLKAIENIYSVNLVVEGSGREYQSVWNSFNQWDMDTWVAVMHNTYTNYSQSPELFATFFKENPTLVLDIFGNICVQYGGRNVVIYPASCNQHLTKAKKYNMINSTVLGAQYGKANSNQIMQYLNTGSHYIGNSKSVKGAEGVIKVGDGFVYFDSYNSSGVNAGQKIMNLMDSNIYSTTGNNISPSIKIADSVHLGGGFVSLSQGWNDTFGETGANWGEHSDFESIIASTAYYGILVAERGSVTGDSKVPIYAKLWTTNGEVGLFGEPVYIVSGISNDNSRILQRNAINELFQYASGKKGSNSSTLQIPSASDVRSKISTMIDYRNIGDLLFYSEEMEFSDHTQNDVKTVSSKNLQTTALFRNSLFNTNVYEQPIDGGNNVINVKSQQVYDLMLHWSIKNKVEQINDLIYSSVVKVYPKSSTMQSVINTLHVKESEEFAVWTPYIYVTYLQIYGLMGVNGEHEFNTGIFSESSDVLNTTGETLFNGIAMSEEEKQQAVLNMSYLLLDNDSPTAQEYRATWFQSALSSLMYKWYSALTNGGAIMNGYNGYSTRNSSGFLRIENYSENFLTSVFLNYYAQYVLILLGIFILIIFIAGIILRKTWIWYFISILTVVNLLLATPTLGDITPYVSNRIVESLFAPKMTYWNMAESIANAKLEEEYNENEDKETDASISALVRMLNVVYLDRSLMVKSDISKKVIEDSTGVVSELQSMTTTKWLLPILMRQFTATDGSADYVYTAVGDLYDNVTSLYWYYVPTDKLSAKTIKANSVVKADSEEDFSADILKPSQKSKYFSGYKSTQDNTGKSADVTYYCINRNPNGTYDTEITNDEEHLTHTAFYLLDYASLAGSGSTVTIPRYKFNGDTRTIDKINIKDSDASTIRTAENQMEKLASSYVLSEGVEQCYGYLWLTESTMPYMYLNVRDTFRANINMSRLVSELQGGIGENKETGEEYRISFMHSSENGAIRDFCDMREMFTNVIPYMYSNLLVTGGFNGDDGVLGDNKMLNFPIYNNNLKSWFLRSNWVIKLMENSDLIRQDTIYDKDGNSYKVSNPMDTTQYPEERPMIFSEAEMIASGLTRKDLSIVELKILDFYEETEKDWTMLLNYVNTDGITPDVMYRQMALDATLEFNKTFSVNRMVNSSMAMYPQTLDLRFISFDSVMKLLLLNSTKNTSYVYGDSILAVLNNSDLGTAFLMLLIATLCVGVIPIVRNILLAIMFYLSFLSLITNIISEHTTKFKITAGFLISSLLFLAINLGYYSVFALMVNFNSADEVLTLNNFTVNVGAPIGQFTIILILDIAYLVGCWLLGKFIILNRKDMGFEKYAMWTSNALSKVSSTVRGVGKGLSGRAGNISNMFSQIKADFSKSPIGGKSGYDTIDKGNVKRDKIEVVSTNNKQTAKNVTNKQDTTHQENYNYNIQNLQNEIREDARASESIRNKVESGASKISNSTSSKPKTPSETEVKNGGINRQTIESQWNKRQY